MNMLLFGKKEATWPPEGPQSNMLIKFLGSWRQFTVHLSTEVSVTYCKGHQKSSTEEAWGNQAAGQAAKRAALQNNDLIGVATLVSQTNLPETPSYIEVRLKAKRRVFKKIIWGGSKRRESFFCLGTSSGSWLAPYMLPLILGRRPSKDY